MAPSCGLVQKQRSNILCHSYYFACLLAFYILTTSKVISGQKRTHDSVHSCQLYSAALMEDQTARDHVRDNIMMPSQPILALS